MQHFMKPLLAAVLLCAGIIAAHTQGSLYSLAAVPDVVKTNASVVVHSESISLEIESVEKSVYKVHKVYTVLNENGKDWLMFYCTSSSWSTLTDVALKVFDQTGKQVGRYKKKDMVTQGYGENLIDDGFVTWYEVIAPSYPVTVELEYEIKSRQTLSMIPYQVRSKQTGVLSSDYTIRAPSDLNLRFRNVGTDLQPVITTDGSDKIYRWAVNSLAPYEPEPGSSASAAVPHIEIVSDQFSFAGYKGDLSSWQNFGKWLAGLYAGLDKLTPEREEFFRNMVRDAGNDREKVRRIYNYLQENFRYVTIQLGIGGLRPLSASFTDKQKYGDCKGLSNFTKAALNAVGITSYVAIINSSTDGEPVDDAFPAHTFNHVILCVPVAGDSIWLECTSQTAEFGELGTSTENRKAVLFNEQGGFLASTPVTQYASNFISSHTVVQIDNDFSAISETKYNTRGRYTAMMSEMYKYAKDDQKQVLVNYLGYKQPDDFILMRENKHSLSLKQAIRKVPEMVSGEKVFINHRLQKLWTEKLPASDKRRLDYYFQYPFEKRDTTVYVLPAGSSVEVLPVTKKLESPFSSYEVQYRFDEPTHSVFVSSSLVLRQHRIPAADYARVKQFFDEVMADHSRKIVVKLGKGEKKAF